MKIAAIDFDDTLIHTIPPETGIPKWERENNELYPHKGWWSRPESLDINTFNFSTKPKMHSIYNEHLKDPDCITILITNRIESLSHMVKKVLEHNNIYFDENNFAQDINSSKSKRLLQLIGKYKHITDVYFYDDSKKHIIDVKELEQPLKKEGINLYIYKVN